MKFCYIDESEGVGGVVVSAGLVVDAARMARTKADWSALLGAMSERLGSTLREFKASDLYRGAGRWSATPGDQRAQVIDDVIAWIADRKHEVVYSGVLPPAFSGATRAAMAGVPDTWCAADLHILLALQRKYQSMPGSKGQVVVVIDQGGHEGHLGAFVRTPPAWTDAYYGRTTRQEPFSQVVDVPYFVDSEHAVLVQTADLCAYVLRRHVELSDLCEPQRYTGEAARTAGWARSLAARASHADLWPQRNRNTTHELFRDIAPPALVALRP